MGGEQASDAAVAVLERMDGEEVEDESTDGEQVRNRWVCDCLLVTRDELVEVPFGLAAGGHGFEDHADSSVSALADEVVARLEVPRERIVGVMHEQTMQMQKQGDGERFRLLGHQVVGGVAIPRELQLRASPG